MANPKKIRQITRVEMANSNDLYDVATGHEITVTSTPDHEGFYNIIINSEEVDYDSNRSRAVQKAKVLIIDTDLIVSGYGTHAGRKFWQLPEKLQAQIKKSGRY